MARRILRNISKALTKSYATEVITFTPEDLYTPLETTLPTIRLLHLQPGTWEDDIDVEIKECSLLQARDQYVAISYTWGRADVDQPVLIRCNGKSVFVSSNLFTVLRRLRQPDRTVLIWADALSINQADDAERTLQVGLMAQIYSYSHETVIWLGEPAANEELGTRVMDINNHTTVDLSSKNTAPRIVWKDDEADQRLRDAYLLDARRQIPTYRRAGPDIFGAFCLLQELAEGVPNTMLQTLDQPANANTGLHFLSLPSKPEVFAGLARLMSRRWWTRIWVVQETVLSHVATIHYGPLSAPWSMFARAAVNHVRQSQEQCLDLAGTLEGSDILNQFSTLVLRIEDTRRYHQVQPNATTLLSLLWKFKPLEASDRRDKVFALLGLTTDWQGRARMLPDYSHSIATTLLRTTIGNIQRSRSLLVLAGDLEDILNRKRSEGLASWVMDWGLRCLATEIERVASLKMYNAGGSGDSIIRFHEEPSILEVEAIYIDTVEAIGGVSRHTQISDTCAVIREWNLLMKGFEKRLGSYPTGGGTYDNAFWRTLIGDLIHTGTTTGLEANKSVFRRAEAREEDAFRAWRMWSRCISRDTLGRSAAFTQRDLDEGISSIHYALKIATSSRRFFLTTNGYMGIAPKTTIPGDRLYVFKNSNVPFIVRQHRSLACKGGLRTTLVDDTGTCDAIGACSQTHQCVQLIGDCFAYGLMDGEALQSRNVCGGKLYLA